MSNKGYLIVEGIFITAIFGYLAFQLVRTALVHWAVKHPALKRFLARLHLDDEA